MYDASINLKIIVGGGRNPVYDLMKGIGILLMMWCHLIGGHNTFVYSFHMPLFFILGGMFSKDEISMNDFKCYTLKNCRRLLLPYFVTMLMLCMWGAIQTAFKHDVSFFTKYLVSMLWASSDSINTMLGFAYVGPLWFLFALFWCRELHYILSLFFSRLASTNVNFYILAVCATISYVASYVHSNYYFPLPFCITQGLSCMVFYAVGSFYKKINSLPIWCMCFLALSWALALWIGGMN